MEVPKIENSKLLVLPKKTEKPYVAAMKLADYLERGNMTALNGWTGEKTTVKKTDEGSRRIKAKPSKKKRK